MSVVTNTRTASEIPQNPSRRAFLAAGSAVAVFGALGAAVAEEASSADPIFAAIAELARVRERVETIGEAHSTAEDAYHSARPKNLFVEFEGQQFRDFSDLDSHFKTDGALSRENILWAIRNMRAKLPQRVSPAEKAARGVEREIAYRAARNELLGLHAQEATAREHSNFDAADAAWNEAVDSETDAEMAIFETMPTSKVGAVALLRFIAADMGRFSGHEDEIKTAIRNAVAVLEGEA